jgi:hypothetical protein
MTSVADIPWNELRIGDKVISAMGFPGVINKLVEQEKYSKSDSDRYLVGFAWSNGNISPPNLHYCLDKVQYVQSRWLRSWKRKWKTIFMNQIQEKL